MKQQRKDAGGVATGEVTERPRGKSPAVPKDGKGERLGPSRVPRRQEETDESIGQGEDVVQPRDEAARDDKQQ